MHNAKRNWMSFGPALLAILTSCTDVPTTGLHLPPLARDVNVPFDHFFQAWSQSFHASPIRTQMFALDTRQDRQYAGFVADQNVLSFATANPGQLYINGDEPDQSCIAPYDYAGTYHDFVAAVRGADPTARFSPAGFAEPNNNTNCCPNPPGSCYTNMHSTGYAQQFYDSYVTRYGVAPPVNEWRFHDFAGNNQIGEVNSWWTNVSGYAAWSVAHGANMVLGSWGFLGWATPSSCEFQVYMEQAMQLVYNDPRINGAVWWSYESWGGYNHYLALANGSLTPEGKAYSNPIIKDTPSSVAMVGFSGGRGEIKWTNTNSQLAIQAEFWREPAGGSFAPDHSDFVAALGTSTPIDQFTVGDLVEGRAAYYNTVGICGPWSALSSARLMH
jgi:hypothetical protein